MEPMPYKVFKERKAHLFRLGFVRKAKDFLRVSKKMPIFAPIITKTRTVCI